jgi:hypothetical protein
MLEMSNGLLFKTEYVERHYGFTPCTPEELI